MPAAWDQKPDESPAQHVQFLIYRNLGPSRTVRAAYRKYLKALQLSDRVPARAPGNWQEHAVRHHWRDRAERWDQWRLTTYGNRVAVLYTRALEVMARKLLVGTVRHKPGDKEWRHVLETMDRVADQLAPARKAGALKLDGANPDAGETARAHAEASRGNIDRKQPVLADDGVT